MHRRLGGPLPHQLANAPQVHPCSEPGAPLITVPCGSVTYPVLVSVSRNYPGYMGRLPTCYSPVRHCFHGASSISTVRLACIRHAASVHPEPGSNSPFDLSSKMFLTSFLSRFCFSRNWRFLVSIYPVFKDLPRFVPAVSCRALIYITKSLLPRQHFF